MHSEILCPDLRHIKQRRESRRHFLRVAISVTLGHLSEKWFSLQKVE